MPRNLKYLDNILAFKHFLNVRLVRVTVTILIILLAMYVVNGSTVSVMAVRP